jgi:hypothetical protein
MSHIYFFFTDRMPGSSGSENHRYSPEDLGISRDDFRATISSYPQSIDWTSTRDTVLVLDICPQISPIGYF